MIQQKQMIKNHKGIILKLGRWKRPQKNSEMSIEYQLLQNENDKIHQKLFKY